MTRAVITMTIDDAEHYTPAEREAIIASYPPHERDARAKGIPIMGSGLVFPISEDKLKVDPFEIPHHWAQGIGIDFGWDHPFGAAKLAWDRDADCLYVTACYREREATPIIHSAAIRPWGDWVPVFWPHDGLQHDKTSGKQLKESYAGHGLKMWHEHATHEKGGYGIEAGITEMLERMQTGRFKVFSTLNAWFEEFRLYHREDGLIVKLRDDILSATRIAVMMRRHFEINQTEDYSLNLGGMSEGAWLGA